MKKIKHSLLASVMLAWRHYHGHRPRHKETPIEGRARRARMMLVGAILMLVGVLIADTTAHCATCLKLAGDTFGFLLHALGAIPYLKVLAELVALE